MRLISTHALREEGDPAIDHARRLNVLISTHALREEGDSQSKARRLFFSIFLPTPSARRATLNRNYAAYTIEFLPTPSARRATRPRPAPPTA